jgi:hypothetical protein
MFRTARRSKVFVAALAFLAGATAIAAAGAPQNRPPAATTSGSARVRLQPRFTPGRVMRYRVALESDSSTRQSGSIKDPQGPASLDVTWDAVIRLEVSAAERSAAVAPPGRTAAGTGAPIRLRITYETSQATLRSDTPEPRADDIQTQYAQLAGRSLEFTLTPGGQVSDIRGLEGLLTDDKTRAAVQQWIVQLSAASTVPADGIVPGQKWNSTQPADLPLAGLSWRTDSTYVRNEPCALASAATAATGAAGVAPRSERADCAVILSRLALVTGRAARDATPDDYRRNNLRTSGHWTGTGQSLLYVSLDTGWVVSNTQESTQEMDVTITDASPNPVGAARQSGSVTTRSQVSLLSDEASAPGTSSNGAAPAPPAR